MTAALLAERRAAKLLADHLTSRMPDVKVFDRWPSEVDLPEKAISVIAIGAAEIESQTPQLDVSTYGTIHATLPAALSAPASTNEATAIALAADLRTAWNAHVVDVAAHAGADATNVLTSSVPVTLSGAKAVANELRSRLPSHVAKAPSVHLYADALYGTVTSAQASTLASTVALLNELRQLVASHFSTRLYLWKVGDFEAQLQVDVWTRYEIAREELLARVVGEMYAGFRYVSGELSPDPTDSFTVLAFPDDGTYWGGRVVFSLGDLERSHTTQQRLSEFRATYTLAADGAIIVPAQSPRMATINFQAAMNGDAPANWTV